MKNRYLVIIFVFNLLFISCSKEEIPIVRQEANLYQQLKNIENNKIFLQKLDMLFFDASTKDYETGYILYPSKSSLFRYEAIEGGAFGASISFTPKSSIDGIMHSHYETLYPCFSPADIKAIYDLYIDEKINDHRIFFTIVANSKDIAYLAAIDNITEFLEFSAKNLSSAYSYQQFENRFIYTQEAAFQTTQNLEASHEISLIKILKNSALKLFKYSKKTQKWSLLNLPSDL